MRVALAFILASILLVAPVTKGIGLGVSASYGAPEIVLHLRPAMVSGNSVKLPYEIPYPGYIEFYLFDSDKKKIWEDFGVKAKGEHAQALRLDKLEKGKVYHYEFWYKGKPYPGKFTP